MITPKKEIVAMGALANAIALVTGVLRAQSGQHMQIPEESSGYVEELVAAKLQSRLSSGVSNA